MAPCGPCQEQGRDVRANDENQQSDRAEEQPESPAHTADNGVFERLNLNGQVAVGLRVLCAELFLDSLEVR